MILRCLLLLTLIAATPRQPPPPAPSSAPIRVYSITLEGAFGRTVAPQPFREAVAQAKSLQAEVVVVRFECDYLPEPAADGIADPGAFEQLETARLLDPVLTDATRGDPEWTPRVVFWIRHARGGAGLLAFVNPELYYTSDAVHDAVELWPTDPVDIQIERQKHRSLRFGRAQGLALKGGHPLELLNAMVRRDYVLSADFTDTGVRLREDDSGATLLTDATDCLSLGADMAKRLGLSSGTADTQSELFTLMGLPPTNIQRVGDAEAIFHHWRDELLDAERDIPALRRRFNEVTIEPPYGYDQREAARRERTRLAREMLALLDRFDGSLNAAAIGEEPDRLREWVADVIVKIQQQQSLDKR